MRWKLCVLPLVLIVAACGSAAPSGTPNPVAAASHTPLRPSASASPTAGASPTALASPTATTRPTASPSPLAPSAYKTYGVLVDHITSPSLIVNVVGTDGKLFASLKLAKRTPISNASGHAVEIPYVSTSSTTLYALDGDSSVLAMRLPDGKQSLATRLSVSAGMEAAFAVSPDDTRIAVAVLDFNRSPAHVTLYTDNLAGGNKKVIFESDSDYVWPVGWHAGLLVLGHAYGAYEEDIAKAAPGRDNPYSAVSYHLVNPANADRIYLLGACTVSGPLSPAGSGCIQGGTIDWLGNVSDSWSTTDWGQISSAASLSADGSRIAAAENTNPALLGIWLPDASISMAIDGPGVREWAGWLDSAHLVIGSELRPDWPTEVWNLSTGTVTTLPTYGFYAARLPTDIV